MFIADSEMKWKLLFKEKIERKKIKHVKQIVIENRLRIGRKEVVRTEAQKTFTKLLMPQSYFSLNFFLLVLKLLNICSTYSQDEWKVIDAGLTCIRMNPFCGISKSCTC